MSETTASFPKEGYFCQQCGAAFGECMACEMPDCGPYVRGDAWPKAPLPEPQRK